MAHPNYNQKLSMKRKKRMKKAESLQSREVGGFNRNSNAVPAFKNRRLRQAIAYEDMFHAKHAPQFNPEQMLKSEMHKAFLLEEMAKRRFNEAAMLFHKESDMFAHDAMEIHDDIMETEAHAHDQYNQYLSLAESHADIADMYASAAMDIKERFLEWEAMEHEMLHHDMMMEARDEQASQAFAHSANEIHPEAHLHTGDYAVAEEVEKHIHHLILEHGHLMMEEETIGVIHEVMMHVQVTPHGDVFTPEAEKAIHFLAVHFLPTHIVHFVDRDTCQKVLRGLQRKLFL